MWHFPTAPQETRGDTEPSSLLAEKQALHLPGEWQSPVRLDVLLYDSADAALSLSSPSLFISREKTKQRASWGMRLQQEKHSTGDGDRKGLGASFLALGTLHVLHHCRWTESLDCLGMEAPSSSTLHTAMPVRPAQGPERAVHARLPGAPLGKAVTITHEAAGKVKGSARKSSCCQTPAWRDTPCLDRNKEEEIAETKPTERAACPERKMSSVVSKKRVPLAKGRVSGILEK